MRPLAAAALLLALAASPALGDTMPLGDAAPPPAAAVYWALGLRYPAHAFPDCNDYARAALAKMTAGRAAAAYTETGEGHMVATFDARGDTWVIDNRFPGHAIYWRDLPYKWVSRQDGALYREVVQ